MKTLKLALPLVVLALVGCGGSENKPARITYEPEKIILTGDLNGCIIHPVTLDSSDFGFRRLFISKCKSVDSTSNDWSERVSKTTRNYNSITIDETKSQVQAKLSDSAKELIGVKPKCDLSYLVSTAQTAKAIAALKEIENLSYEEKLALGVCK